MSELDLIGKSLACIKATVPQLIACAEMIELSPTSPHTIATAKELLGGGIGAALLTLTMVDLGHAQPLINVSSGDIKTHPVQSRRSDMSGKERVVAIVLENALRSLGNVGGVDRGDNGEALGTAADAVGVRKLAEWLRGKEETRPDSDTDVHLVETPQIPVDKPNLRILYAIPERRILTQTDVEAAAGVSRRTIGSRLPGLVDAGYVLVGDSGRGIRITPKGIAFRSQHENPLEE